MSDIYPTILVPKRALLSFKSEALGTKFKFWFEGDSGEKYIYKEGRPGSGEDWSEKVAAELCTLLDIPHAKYNFAIWQDQDGNSRRGVVSLSFLDGEDGFLPWLFYQDPAKGQTLDRVLELWQHYAIIENFVGYIMLDAWIGNTDRHAENWGTVVHVNDEAHKSRKFEATLAPTFDHASSLGVRLSDDDRKRRLTTRDTRQNVAAYAARCKTPFSATINGSVQKNLKTHQVFEYLARRCTKIAHFWLDRLNDIPKDDIESVFSRVPRDRMTETAAEFAIALLNENRRQLMRLKGELK